MTRSLETLPRAAFELLMGSGAGASSHSGGRSLTAHLLGTWQLLRRWGSDEATCLAGLFHSIYGTNAFRHACLGDGERDALRAAIGIRAERLAWLFGHLDRPRVLLQALECNGPSSAFSDSELVALATIDCANLVEQGRWTPSLRGFYCSAIDRGWLGDVALSDISAGLAHHHRGHTLEAAR